MKPKRSLAWGTPLVGFSALAVALFYYLHSPGQRAHTLTIRAGHKPTTRDPMARVLQRGAVTSGIHLEILDSPGSEDALDRVNAGTLDLALVLGGLRVENRPNVRQIATLNIEPL